MEKQITERQLQVLIEIVISIVLFGLTIWALYYEFGWGIFNEPILWIIFIYLALFVYVLFRMRWAEASKKSIDEKLDALISEITEIKELLKGNKSRKAKNNGKQ